jgi:hypothetical protein
MRIAKQIVMIVLGFLAACYFTGTFIAVVLHFGASEVNAAYKLDLLTSAITLSKIITNLMMIPAFIFIVIAELVPLRNRAAYVLFAGTVGLSLSAITGAWQFIIVGLFGGALAGLIYWVIAGRTAGLRKPKTP